MRGGVAIYQGSAAAARNHVEADRSRADDYYLAEGTGAAERYVATPSTVVAEAPMDGDAYERWVAGYDVDTGVAKGRLVKVSAAGRGRWAVTRNPPSGRALVVRSPPNADARLRIPIRPLPGGRSGDVRNPGPSSAIVMVTASRSQVSRPRTLRAAECLVTLVRASWMMR